MGGPRTAGPKATYVVFDSEALLSPGCFSIKDSQWGSQISVLVPVCLVVSIEGAVCSERRLYSSQRRSATSSHRTISTGTHLIFPIPMSCRDKKVGYVCVSN